VGAAPSALLGIANEAGGDEDERQVCLQQMIATFIMIATTAVSSQVIPWE